MLVDCKIITSIAVKDLEQAKKFYGDTLGMTPGKVIEAGAAFVSGGVEFFVYESEFAGTNQATTAAWNVGDDIENVVEDLKMKGLSFEHYDFPGVRLEGDIHIMGEGDKQGKVAWFKDPDGNIFALNSGMS